MTHSPYKDRLGQAVVISKAAAATATDFFLNRNALDITTKSPGQAVTEADLAVEDQIRRALRTTFPGEPIVGEEFGGDAARAFWTVDPIDGTANFVNGLPFWGIALGHCTDGVADLGVIILPMLNVVVATDGGAVFLNDKPFNRTAPPIPTVSLGHAKPATQADTLDLHRQFQTAQFAVYHWRCSAVSLAWAGLGQISGHLHQATTLWDTIPGAAICQAAGLDTRTGTDPSGVLWVKTGDADVHAVSADLWECSDQGRPQ